MLGFPLDLALPLCDQGSISDSGGTENPLVALNFRWRAERLRVVIGEFDCGPSFDRGDFGD